MIYYSQEMRNETITTSSGKVIKIMANVERRFHYYYTPEGCASILEVKDTDIATGMIKGRDLYTGTLIRVERKNVIDRVYLSEQEIARRFPNYPLI